MPVPVLVEVVGHMEGRRILVKKDVILGRVAGPGVTAVPNREVSRRHCCISQGANGQILVEDLGSANGTWVNGQRTDRSILKPGDRIALGRTVFEVCLETMQDEVPTLDGSAQAKQVQAPRLRNRSNIDGGLSIDASASQFGRLPQDLSNLLEVAKHRDLLHRLCELSRAMATTTDLDDLSDQITLACLEMFPTARRSHIVLSQGGNLKLVATRHRTPTGSESVAVKAGELPISHSILTRAIRQRESISSVDATMDDRFMGQHSVVINNIRAFMCAPLLFHQDVLGAILVDTTVGSKGFTEQDLDMITAVGAQLAVQVRAVQLIAENIQQAEVRAHLSRYLSPSLVKQVLDGKLDLKLGGELRDGAVLFGDLVGFTSLSERMGPTELVSLLNQHFTHMVSSVFAQGGSVNKFGGDSLLAVWGLTRSDPTDTLSAAKAGLQMQNNLFELTLKTGLPMGMGIGINFGSFVAGNVGSAEQMEYTVLGDSVNVAQRVESQAGPTQVLLSPNALGKTSSKVGGFLLPEVSLKGKREPVLLYSLRSVSLDENSFLTSIPVRLRKSNSDENWVPAVLIKITRDGDKLSLDLRSAFFEGDRVNTPTDIQISPPEYPEFHTYQGTPRFQRFVADSEESKTVISLQIEVDGGSFLSFFSAMIEPKAGCVPVKRK